MLVVTHFADVSGAELETVLTTLAARPGYLRGSAGRSTDDASAWVLVTEWDSVGSYRRALGNYEVKLHATPVLARALDLPSAFEQLLGLGAGGELERHGSDLADPADPSDPSDSSGPRGERP